MKIFSKEEKCRLTEDDFGVESQSGRDYMAEFSSGFDIQGLFEGGEIDPGGNLNGSLLFVIKKGEKGLTLVYPRMFGFGSTARFTLGK